jgi:HEAT repeat protein
MAKYWQGELQHLGVQADNNVQIIKAAQSNDAEVRYLAVGLLALRLGQDGIPVLRQALDDNFIAIRIKAAHFLGTLADKSGLERMQKDFEEFIPKEEEPNDPKVLRDERALDQWKKNHRYRISRALEVGKVLAELGDFRAYDLAAREGLTTEYELGAIRMRAAEALGEIGKKDVNELKIQGKDPIDVLCRMAETEKETAVFRRVRIVANEIGGKSEVWILERAANSSHQSERELNITRAILADVKRRVDPNSFLTVDPNRNR